jgi:hypothetical protein
MYVVLQVCHTDEGTAALEGGQWLGRRLPMPPRRLPKICLCLVRGAVLTCLGRPKGLVLFGATRLGKTVWARSLGAHYYAGGLWDMAEFHPQEQEYAIWDDMLGGLKAGYFNYKNWLGGQFAFTIQDKYGKKKSIKWGKPSIFICNTDPRDDPPVYNDRVGMDWSWLEENCVFYEVKEAIFRANTESE